MDTWDGDVGSSRSDHESMLLSSDQRQSSHNQNSSRLSHLVLVEQFSPTPEGWPASATRNSELDLPLEID